MKFSSPVHLADIARKFQCEFDGDADFQVTGINEIHVVSPGEITFVDHPKYYQKAMDCPASVVIIDRKIDYPEGKHLVYAPDPFTIFKKIIEEHISFVPATTEISPSAMVGEGSVIQPGAFIGENVTIGKNCLIHPNVTIYGNIIIGDEVIIHSNTVLGADAFYMKRRPAGYEKFPSCGRVIIEDEVEIGAGCTIDRGVTNDTIIGKGTKMDNQVHIGHDTVIGKNCLIAAQVGISGVVVVEDDVIIWGQVGVAKDLVIGRGAVVHPKSGVMKSLPGGRHYLGAPAVEIKEAMRQWIGIKNLPAILRKFKV